MSQSHRILSLYKQLLRESSKFSAYNYRLYASRKIRDTFKRNKSLADQSAIAKELENGQKSFDMIKRQVIIGNLYSTDKLIIEKSI